MPVIGTTIFYLDGNAYYSPEFPRGGLAATFSIDVTHINLSASVQFIVTVQHKNHDDTTWSNLGVFDAVTSVDVDSKDLTGVKEQVRFMYSFVNGSPAATDAAHFLMMAPSWRPY